MPSFCVRPDMTRQYYHQNRIHLFFIKHEGIECRVWDLENIYPECGPVLMVN